MSPEGDSAPSLYGNRQSGADTESSNSEPEDAPESEFSDEAESEVDPEAAERHLTELLNDRELHDLMRSGEYEAFRERLKKRQSRTEDPDRLAAIKYALANPHEFAEPVQSAPTLWTLNGIGTKVYGEDQFDSLTGLYLKTLYFTFLWIPIFPIRRYLVRSMGDEYQFFAKVDLGNFHHWWRRIIVMGVIAVAGLTAYGVATHQPDVRFVNGFDRAVEVSVGDKTTVEVPAKSVKVEDLPSGKHQFTARYANGATGEGKNSGDATILEQRSFSIPQFSDLIAYNVAGMAPAYVRSVTYYSTTSARREDSKSEVPTITPIAGKSRYVSDNVDYFNAVEPPEEIEMSTGSDKEVRWRFRYDGEGAEVSARMLARHAPDRLGSFLKQAIEFYPRADWVYLELEEHLANLAENKPDKVTEWFDLLEKRAKNNPDTMSIHAFYARQAERYAEHLDRPSPVELYRDRHQKQKSAESALMLAHVTEDPKRAHELLTSVLEKAPEGSALVAEAHTQLGVMKAEQDCEATLDHFDESGRSVQALAGEYLRSYALCLALTDQVDRALSLLEGYGSGSTGSIRYATLYGRVVLDSDASTNPFKLVDDLEENQNVDYRVLVANRIGYPFNDKELEEMSLTARGETYAEINRSLFGETKDLMELLSAEPSHITTLGTGVQSLGMLTALAEGNTSLALELSNNVMNPNANVPRWVAENSSDLTFDGPPPAHWHPDERAAYYIVKAQTASDADTTEAALGKAENALRLHSALSLILEQTRQQD